MQKIVRVLKHGAGHLRGSRLSSLFKHFLGGIEKAQKRNFSIVSNINIIIIIIIIIIIMTCGSARESTAA